MASLKTERSTGALILEALQGTWTAAREISDEALKKTLQIQKEALLLECTSKNGKPRFLARAAFTLTENECRLVRSDYARALLDSDADAIYSI
jgi:hypothetical protein